ncbi:MAG TPA: hypothetical protein VI248_06100 [Kineosporiaceae bacterium]
MADDQPARSATRSSARRDMDRRELLALPAVIDVPTAAKALGLSRTAAYDLIRDDAWPTPVFRLGRLIRIPTAPILALLGIEPVDGDRGRGEQERGGEQRRSAG